MDNAGFWKRLVAMVIDMFLISFFSVVLITVVGMLVGGMMKDESAMLQITQYALPFDFLFFWLYYALQESSAKQATLGKRIVGIYVCSTKDERLNFTQASIRHFAKYLSAIFFIGFLMAGFTKHKQGLHDLIADTLVKNR